MAHQKQKEKNSGSEYSVRLQEKQKLRYNYGLSEKQLLNYIVKLDDYLVLLAQTYYNFLKCD